MRYEVLNIAQQYRDGNISANEAMNSIILHLFPQTTADDVYSRRLIAFMFDTEPNALLGSGNSKHPEASARIMYTKIIYDKYQISGEKIGTMLGTKGQNVRWRLKTHEGLLLSNIEYKKIYNIVTKVI